jgi:hypothetical protein
VNFSFKIPTLSLRSSQNKGAKSKIQIVSNRTIIKDYFLSLQIFTFTFNFQIKIAQIRQKTQFDKKTVYKDFRFLASKMPKISKKDNYSIFGR